MTQHRELQENIWRLLSVSGSNTITARARPTFSIYKEGQFISWIQATTNTGAVTVNVNNLGAKALTRSGSTALVADDLTAGREYLAIYDGTRFQLICQCESTGGSGTPPTTNNSIPIAWARIKANGDIIVEEGFASSARTSLGVYTLDTDFTVGTSSGEPLSAVLVTPSGASGDGGSGVSPFKEFSDYDVAQTDTTSSPFFAHSDVNNAIVVLGPAADDLFKHDLSNFTAAATQYDANAQPVRVVGQSGALNYEGTEVWFSGDTAGTPYPIRSMVVSTGAVSYYNTLDLIAIGAKDDYIYFIDGGNVYAYNDADAIAHTISLVNTWTITVFNSISNVLTWDDDGWGWTFHQNNVRRFKGGTVDHYKEATPTANGAVFYTDCPLTFDTNRNCMYVSMHDEGADPDESPGIFRISGWSATASDAAQWERVTSGPIHQAIHYDPTTDIIFAIDSTTFRAFRYMASTGQLIDIVSVDDTGPDNPQVDYDLDADRHIFYEGIYGYVTGQKGGNVYVIRMEYNGDEISGSASGGGFVAGVLISLGTVIDTNTVKAELFRTLNPAIRADGQFNITVFGRA